MFDLTTDGNSDQEVLLPFSSAVGRDAVQDMGDLDEFDQTQEKPTKLPSKKKPDQGKTGKEEKNF